MQHKRRSILIALGVVTVLPSQWVKPLVSSVILPAHAQTSVCQVSDFVGQWAMTFSTHQPSGLYPNFELFADGSTSDLDSIWGINQGVFILRQDISDYVFTANISTDCGRLEGESTTVFDMPPQSLPSSGTWVAEKI